MVHLLNMYYIDMLLFFVETRFLILISKTINYCTVKIFVLSWITFWWCNLKMVESRTSIWNYGSTGSPNVETRFHIIVSAIVAPKVGSTQQKHFAMCTRNKPPPLFSPLSIFNILKVYASNYFDIFQSFSLEYLVCRYLWALGKCTFCSDKTPLSLSHTHIPFYTWDKNIIWSKNSRREQRQKLWKSLHLHPSSQSGGSRLTMRITT